MIPRVYAVATLDSKGKELEYLANSILEAGASVIRVDVSLTGPPQAFADVDSLTVADHHPLGRQAVFKSHGRDEAIDAMGSALTHFLLSEYAAGRLQAAIGMGGSEGTSLIAPALRSLPLGIPKLLLSTLASGETRAYVGNSDLNMIFPVSDISGLNFLSRRVLRNCAYAAAGMAKCAKAAVPEVPSIGMTMFGVTTPCVDQVRAGIEAKGWEGVVFHAVGTGGAAMEEMAAKGYFRALMDLTTTEIADKLVGGIFPAVPERFDAVTKFGVPAVVSVGALDVVNFGPKSSVPERFRNRLLYSHTPWVTLMRTTPEENKMFGHYLGERLSSGTGPCAVLLPEGGLSALDAPGKLFFDPEADEALFTSLEESFRSGETRRILRVPFHINEKGFADAALHALWEILGSAGGIR